MKNAIVLIAMLTSTFISTNAHAQICNSLHVPGLEYTGLAYTGSFKETDIVGIERVGYYDGYSENGDTSITFAVYTRSSVNICATDPYPLEPMHEGAMASTSFTDVRDGRKINLKNESVVYKSLIMKSLANAQPFPGDQNYDDYGDLKQDFLWDLYNKGTSSLSFPKGELKIQASPSFIFAYKRLFDSTLPFDTEHGKFVCKFSNGDICAGSRGGCPSQQFSRTSERIGDKFVIKYDGSNEMRVFFGDGKFKSIEVDPRDAYSTHPSIVFSYNSTTSKVFPFKKVFHRHSWFVSPTVWKQVDCSWK